MTAVRFVLRGLWFFRGSYLGVLSGSALAAMVLLGALLAGDSVRETLRLTALARLGRVDAVVDGGGRWFRAALADELAADGLQAAPVMQLRAELTVADGGATLGAVQVLGVDERFFRLGPQTPGSAAAAGDQAPPSARGFQINETLARRLDLAPGATVVLRFAKPGLAMAEVPMAGPAPAMTVLRGEVEAIRGANGFGRFSLENSQLPQATVMVPLARLQAAVEQEGKANLMLLHAPPGATSKGLLEAVRHRCTLEDYGLMVKALPTAEAVEVRTTRVFFDPPLAAAVQRALPEARPVITYLVNGISANGKTTPYSMATAVEPRTAPFLPADFSGVVLNSWVAEDLGAEPGDEVRLDYYAVDDANRLVERSATFPVAAVVPLSGLAADRDWMPEFPGVAAAENTSDWDAGVPIDVKRIRERDETYWDEHRGTPKVFLPLAAGRALFGSRWGEFTALRVPAAGLSAEAAAVSLLESVAPAEAGLRVREVRAEGLAAAASPVDFAGLLLGMSLFLMAAAVALAAMLFRFHIEQRNRESGLLAAVGVPPAQVLRWRLAEGLVVVTLGGAAGFLLALGYTRGLLASLATVWDRNAGSGGLGMHVDPLTVGLGLTAFTVLMMVVIWLVTRRQVRQAASLRLEAGSEEIPPIGAAGRPWWVAGWSLAGGIALTGSGWLGVQGAFFLAGFCLLAGGMSYYRRVLRQRLAPAAGAADLTVQRLAALNCARRPNRSMVAAGTLAAGVFMVVSVAAFRKDGGGDWRQRASGTGGFALWAETNRAVARANPDQVDDPLGLGEARHRFGEILPLRVGPGDDASCLNLNQVTRPRLLAVDSTALERRGAFTIKQVLTGCERRWGTLRDGEVMRALVDESTLLWVLKRKLGERLTYQDEWGRDYPVEIAGTLDGSVFQGCFVVDETRFLRHHPQAAGPRVFLVDAEEPVAGARLILRNALEDRGVVVDTTAERMAAFHGVENAYIRIFHLLGGLGVILGSAGLGLLTARNLLERRQEFAIFHTIGVPAGITRRLALAEAAQLARWGLGLGLAAALVAILPGLGAAGVLGAAGWLGVLAGLIALNGWFWSWLACRRYFRASFTMIGEGG